MNNHLKKFFRGNLSPANKAMVRGSEMDCILEELSSTKTQLTHALALELQPAFARLLSAQESLCRITAEEYYIDGFKTGAQLMLEILDDTHESLKPITG